MMANDLTPYKDFIMLAHETPDLIERIGDCPNIDLPVFAGNALFTQIAAKDGYKVEQHNLTGIARLVGPDGHRKAWGSKEVMWEKMQRMTRVEFLERGDVIGVSRKGIYDHYAIYTGNGEVIHYAGEHGDARGVQTVHRTSLKKFLKGSKEYFVLTFSSGYPVKLHNHFNFKISNLMDIVRTARPKKQEQLFSADEVIARAESRLGESEYSLDNNNCEHFVMWCKTGIASISQVDLIKEYVTRFVMD